MHPSSRFNIRSVSFSFLLILAATLVAGLVAWTNQGSSHTPVQALSSRASPTRHRPPWHYGNADARYTLIEYADLECPFCREYFPVLRQWIDANPDVNWQWHHLPLQMHEPAATREARLAECAGEAGGPPAFWSAVAWIYQNTRSDGQGLPENAQYPGITSLVQRCLDSEGHGSVIRAQVMEAENQGISAAPTLLLRDNTTGKTILLNGPAEGDALLSAIDLLSINQAVTATPSTTPKPPDNVGDMP
ncbi:thioredoxin domain-containing protein [Sodalis ligni]|uniref:Thioredoxin-like protein n=1 Tax=Sodalis ligni TaxID=2697027 RepID=A0A4R1N6P1_9GAMM|nr:thioredoxin domain-containing protein [Sodalis ligni]TCL02179.1 thioredoxin-like protein [Sodalis ligni]